MKKLRGIGKVSHASRSGLLVVPLDKNNIPKIGDKVVTRKMELVGVIYDIIGPVSSPYALIKPNNNIKKIIFGELFVVTEYGGGRKGKGERGRKRSRK